MALKHFSCSCSGVVCLLSLLLLLLPLPSCHAFQIQIQIQQHPANRRTLMATTTTTTSSAATSSSTATVSWITQRRTVLLGSSSTSSNDDSNDDDDYDTNNKNNADELISHSTSTTSPPTDLGQLILDLNQANVRFAPTLTKQDLQISYKIRTIPQIEHVLEIEQPRHHPINKDNVNQHHFHIDHPLQLYQGMMAFLWICSWATTTCKKILHNPGNDNNNDGHDQIGSNAILLAHSWITMILFVVPVRRQNQSILLMAEASVVQQPPRQNRRRKHTTRIWMTARHQLLILVRARLF
jgi:hypothetical protein